MHFTALRTKYYLTQRVYSISAPTCATKEIWRRSLLFSCGESKDASSLTVGWVILLGSDLNDGSVNEVQVRILPLVVWTLEHLLVMQYCCSLSERFVTVFFTMATIFGNSAPIITHVHHTQPLTKVLISDTTAIPFPLFTCVLMQPLHNAGIGTY